MKMNIIVIVNRNDNEGWAFFNWNYLYHFNNQYSVPFSKSSKHFSCLMQKHKCNQVSWLFFYPKKLLLSLHIQISMLEQNQKQPLQSYFLYDCTQTSYGLFVAEPCQEK